ncbi:MAG: hypothetical protein H0V25_08100 [Solirubrobacterales bacterium]|nr:hypothetical protein [Solirubrobacterales bacterium]
MGLVGYFARRRARESAIPAGFSGAQDEVPEGLDVDPDAASPPSGAVPGDPSPGVAGGLDLQDLGDLVGGALRQGNATVSTEEGVIDLGAAGLRGRMFEAVDLDGECDSEPESE